MDKYGKIGYVFAVPVWGDAYVDVFIDVALPMLLTEGNFGHFRGRTDAICKIVTNSESYKRMRDCVALRALRDMVPTEIVLMDAFCDISQPHLAMSEAYRLAMDDDRIENGLTTFVFLTADSFWSDGTFRRIEELISAGKKVVAVAGLRAKLEEFTGFVTDHLEKNGLGTRVETEDLVTLALENLHNMSLAHNILSSAFLNVWPSHIYWIGKDVLVAHCFHLHPLAVVLPSRGVKFRSTIDSDLLVACRYKNSEIHVVCKSEEIFGVELSPASRNWGQNQMNPSLFSIRWFILSHTNKYHRMFFSHQIRMNGRCYTDHDVKTITSHSERIVYRLQNTLVLASVLDKLLMSSIYGVLHRNSILRYVVKRFLR